VPHVRLHRVLGDVLLCWVGQMVTLSHSRASVMGCPPLGLKVPCITIRARLSGAGLLTRWMVYLLATLIAVFASLLASPGVTFVNDSTNSADLWFTDGTVIVGNGAAIPIASGPGTPLSAGATNAQASLTGDFVADDGSYRSMALSGGSGTFMFGRVVPGHTPQLSYAPLDSGNREPITYFFCGWGLGLVFCGVGIKLRLARKIVDA